MTNPQNEEKDGRYNRSSDKLLGIIELLSVQDEPMRLQDLSRAVGMNESTTLRYLTTLMNNDYIYQDVVTGRYCLTLKLCAIAANVSRRNSLRNLCLPYLRSLANEFSESVNVTEEYDMEVVYIEAINGPQQLLMTTRRPGDVCPMHCTAAGKLMLLEYSERDIRNLIATKGLKQMTENTITSQEDLRNELAIVRKQGYAFDNEEYERGARCVAAPIIDYSSRIIGAISVSGPVTRMTDGFINEKLPVLLEAARQISIRMGSEKFAQK